MSASIAPARIYSFPAVAAPDAQRLILGSMPGLASLQAGQYYAHARNQFWPIMGELLGASPCLPYPARLAALQAHRIALWDVLHSCVRPGSLDAAIEPASAAPNDLLGLLARVPRLQRICCNGSSAFASLQRYFSAALARQFPQLQIVRLPSTSPAHASWSAERKLAAWREALQ